jgi:hypothetical protein
VQCGPTLSISGQWRGHGLCSIPRLRTRLGVVSTQFSGFPLSDRGRDGTWTLHQNWILLDRSINPFWRENAQLGRIPGGVVERCYFLSSLTEAALENGDFPKPLQFQPTFFPPLTLLLISRHFHKIIRNLNSLFEEFYIGNFVYYLPFSGIWVCNKVKISYEFQF